MARPEPAGEAQPPAEDRHLLDHFGVVVRRRHVVGAVCLALTLAAGLRAALVRPVYKATAQILIERDNPSVLSFKEVSQVDAARDDYYQTQYKLLESRALARRVIERLDLLQDPEFGGPRPQELVAAVGSAAPGASPVMESAVDDLLERLTVQPLRNSRLVLLEFEAGRPDLAAQVANRLAQVYIEQTLDFRFQTSSEAAEWLRTQIEEQRRKVEEAEISLQELKEREGIVNVEERRTLLEQRLRELGTALTTLKTSRLEKQALHQEMKRTANPDELPEVMKNPVVQALRMDLTTLERQHAQLMEKYLDEHPEVVKVRNQIAEVRRKLAIEGQRVIRGAENEFKAVAAQEASLAAALDSAKADALDLSRRSVQYDTVKREAEAGASVLNSLLSRHKETDVAQALKNSNIRVIDPAAPPRTPVRPRPIRDTALGMLAGLVLGVAAAFFLEYLDRTIKTPGDVRTSLGAPLLAVIPEAAGPPLDLLLIRHTARGGFAEGYRVLRTALGFSWTESRPRILLVTSTLPGEGKSLTAANLALTLASPESRVLLVEGDLRKPKVHSLMNARRAPGLSDVLVGKVKAADAMQRVNGSPLTVLSGGTPPPNPADLLASDAVRVLLESLRGQFSWIVIDSPPVAAVAEPLMLAPLADGVVVVVGAEMVPREAARHTLERIAETGARILGVVLNRAPLEKYAYYGHYHGHYYGQYHYEAEAAMPGKVASINEPRTARRT
jgi:succinoglycan biosynthesis transport protein ExoP